MKKNVASQSIGAQMITASDGSAFTGSVTVSVTGDAGTQATGSVGSGACTHEGNGYHTYAPAQAETNYDLIAFTFTGSGAIPVTVQVYTSFPQTVDNNTLLASIDGKVDTLDTNVDQIEAAVITNAAGVDIAADIAAVKAETANIVADTNELQTDDVPGLIATLDAVVDTVKADTAAILVDTSTTLEGHLTDIKGGTFSGATDSLEAIRDRGDAAWTTGAGGTPPQLLQNTTIATLASQTSFTLAAGSSDDDAYNGAVVVVTDQSTSTQKAVGSVSDYAGSTKTVTLSSDPGVFTMAVGDTIDIIANASTAPSAAAVRAEMDSNSTQLAAIVADTNELQSDDVPGLIAALDAVVDTVKADTAAILTDTGTTIPAQISGLNDIAATDIVSGGAITTSGGAVSNVTLVATTTANTDMRGTDSAATASALATVDANVDAVKLQTDKLTFTVANQLDANIQYVNDVAVTGDGTSGSEWGP